MQFGLFYEWPNPTLRNWKLLFEEGVEQIQYSEALGFDYCLIAEHHFTNYGNSPAPLMQALYIGQRTKRLRIGTAAVILPVWQPCAWLKKSRCWTISLTAASCAAWDVAIRLTKWLASGGISAPPDKNFTRR